MLVLLYRTIIDSPTSIKSRSHRTQSAKSNTKPSRRRFISYESSPWEQDWLNNVDKWSQSSKQMCAILRSRDLDRVHNFLNATCTDRYPPPNQHWCKQDDFNMPLYYNSANRSAIEWSYRIPRPLKRIATIPLGPLNPHDEDIFSKFVFQDDVTGETYIEYIEPLVAGLRHPLANCHDGGARANSLPPIVFRGYLLPPPSSRRFEKVLYFDAGASSWDQGDGGPSLKYFVNAWQRQGISFDSIYAYEMSTTPTNFYATVPESHRERTLFRQCAVSSSPETASADHPFLPHEIAKIASADDYVLLKLDIDSPMIEDGSIRYMLDDNNNMVKKVDEIAWEHHVYGNVIMRDIWDKGGMTNMTLRESYELFLRLRKKGIRAHSWV